MRTGLASILVASFLPFSGMAVAGNSFILPDGLNRAPAVTLHCVSGSAGAIPCGTTSNPLVVTPAAGGSSAANQQQQINAEQASAQGIGTLSDGAFSGGQGSVIAVLKALWSATSTGVPALPNTGILTSRTVMLPSATSTQVFPINSSRRYLSFQVPQASAVWINVMGGAAGPNAVDCVYFAAGTFYESGQFINRGAITVYAPVAAIFSAWES